MKTVVGDEILVDSERAGEPPRAGKILEVIAASYGTRYRVAWDDGHETVIHPIAGTVRIRHPGDEQGWHQPEHAR